MSSTTANDTNDMTAQPPGGLVLRDQAGTYYLLTPELLEQARVPDERRAALEQQLGEADDTAGYYLAFNWHKWLSRFVDPDSFDAVVWHT